MATESMNSRLNIGGDPNDQHYRYKRRIFNVRIIGQNTVILNFVQVCEDLNCTPTGDKKKLNEALTKAISKTFAKEFSTAIHLVGNSLRLNGHHAVVHMNEILNKFVQKHILCPNCKNPEWCGTRENCPACGAKQNEKKRTESNPEKDVKEIPVGEWERQCAEHMIVLYNIRDRLKNGAEFDRVNKLLNVCWKINSKEEWEKVLSTEGYIILENRPCQQA